MHLFELALPRNPLKPGTDGCDLDVVPTVNIFILGPGSWAHWFPGSGKPCFVGGGVIGAVWDRRLDKHSIVIIPLSYTLSSVYKSWLNSVWILNRIWTRYRSLWHKRRGCNDSYCSRPTIWVGKSAIITSIKIGIWCGWVLTSHAGFGECAFLIRSNQAYTDHIKFGNGGGDIGGHNDSGDLLFHCLC